jgi:hypothetical protein
MKTFLWLSTLGVAVLSLCCWAVSSLVLRSLADTHQDFLLPAVTVLVLRPNWWMLFYPLPWAIYAAVLTLRRELSAGGVFLFAGTAILAATLLACAVVLACVLPYLPLKQ